MNTIKAIDPTRPVHYERFGMGEGNPSDFDQKMYGTPAEFASIAKDKSLTKPFYICEFAHAMFNSMGSVAEYSDVFDRCPEIARRRNLGMAGPGRSGTAATRNTRSSPTAADSAKCPTTITSSTRASWPPTARPSRITRR